MITENFWMSLPVIYILVNGQPFNLYNPETNYGLESVVKLSKGL